MTRAQPSGARRGRRVLFFLTILGVHLFFSNHYLDGDMANAVLNLTVALAERREVTLDTHQRNSHDLVRWQGHAYSGLAPGLSVVAIPLYASAKVLLRSAPVDLEERLDRLITHTARPTLRPTSIVFTPHPTRFIVTHVLLNLLVTGTTLWTAWLLYVIGTQTSDLQGRPWQLALAFAFATPYLYWGNYVATQPVAAALLFSAFYLLEFQADRPRSRGAAVLAGLLLGLACAINYPTLLGAGLVGLSSLRRRGWWTVGPMVLGALLPLVLLGLYHQAVFGWALTLPYMIRDSRLEPWMGDLLLVPTATRLVRLLFGWTEGLLTTMPILVVAVLGMGRLRHDPRRRSLVHLGLGMTLLYGGYAAVRGEDSSVAGLGSRYFLPAIPFLMLGLLGLEPLRRRSPKWWVVTLLAVASVGVNLLGAFYGVELKEEGVPALMTRLGLSSYTLRTLNEYGLFVSPLGSTLIVLGVLLTAAWLLARATRGVTRIPD